MSATITLEISDYLPTSFNYDGFSFIFKTDSYEETIEYSKKNQIIAQITNLKKDRKFTIRVYKNSSVVGISEVVLPQLLLLKRDNSFNKTISISMIDSVKRALLGKDWTRTLQIAIKAKIEYKEEDGSSTNWGHRSSSAKPIGASEGSVKNRSSGLRNLYGVNSTGAKNSTKGNEPRTNFNNKASIFGVKEINKQPEQVDEFGEVENSFIDSIFNNEHVSDFDDVGKTLNDFIQDFKLQIEETENVTDPEQLKLRAREIIPSLFNMQKVYYSQFNKANQTNKRLRELLVKYNEKFREITKKTNRLHEALESNHIRKDMATLVTGAELKRVKNAIALNHKELDIFKSLFKIQYTSQDLNNFKEKNYKKSEEEGKKLMLKAVENILNDNTKKEKLFENLSEEQRIQFVYLTSKYSLGRKSNDDLINQIEVDEKKELDSSMANARGSMIVMEDVVNFDTNLKESPLKYDPNEDALKKIKHKLTLVHSGEDNDVLDNILENYVNSIYQKKKLSNIPFRRLSKGEYEFGTQRILLIAEGNIIKVRTSTGFILLERYLEINAPLEEAKILRANNLSQKNNNSKISTKSNGFAKKK